MTLIGIVLVTLLIAGRVFSDNCVIPWMESGREVAQSEYILELSVVNTTGNLRSYFPDTYYDSESIIAGRLSIVYSYTSYTILTERLYQIAIFSNDQVQVSKPDLYAILLHDLEQK